jgi:hypothetical protein
MMARLAAAVAAMPRPFGAAGSRRPRGRTAALAVILSIMTVSAAVALTASPAAASTPQCTGWGNMGDQGVMPEASNGSTNCWLARGSHNDGVWALQMALVHCYYEYVGPHGPDSDFGPSTFAALEDVQRRFRTSNPGVAVDGVYGPQMASLMAFWQGC